jgi:hypothetical protein
MRFTRISLVLTAGLLSVAGTAGTAGATALTAGSATAAAGRPGRAVSLPGGELFGVAATSARNAWAVGQVTTSGKTVILHWNGHAWKRVASPTPKGGGALYGVAATSARNAWAVGGSDGPPGQPEIVHWNGTAWKRVAIPSPKGGGALFGVTATSARNAWAVGCAGNCFQGSGGIQTLVLHWNGTAWRRVPSPSPGSGSSLSSVTAVSARHAWAVGCTAFCFLSSASPHTVILRWNGTTWRRVASPAPARIGALNGVAATSASNVWAVGCAGHCFGPMATTKTMILRWNGTAWRHMTSPSPAGNSLLTAVTATSARNAWAAGYTRGSGKTLIERWNGTAWRQVASPTPGQFSELAGVAASSARNAWAVGSDLNGVILQHWNGTRWK